MIITKKFTTMLINRNDNMDIFLKISLKYLFVFLFMLFAIACQNPTNEKREIQYPSLIPLPQSVKWTNAEFLIDSCRGIVVSDDSLEEEAKYFSKRIGVELPIVRDISEGSKYYIHLKKGGIDNPSGQNEEYNLIVKNTSILLVASTSHGIFNGLQTLVQLINDRKAFGCEIADYPEYQWRGFMIDVARNFQSVRQLKEQIEAMGYYKLNVLHLHLTDDIAWRLQIKEYPQLTSQENMIRDKGEYYSIEEMKDLIQYCKERHIILVPEIDMPGHSAAFTRAMGVDMQSEKGLIYMKNIIQEVCSSYDIPYIHIGADEVKIRNNRFLPEIIQLIQRHGIQTIGWDPGGELGANTIHQQWGYHPERDEKKKYIYSSALYITDMAPQSGVVNIFNRQLGEQPYGDSSLLGAEICLWGDRKMAHEKDVILMNAVYPFMLAFSERSWHGGGYPGIVKLDIGPDCSNRAKEFKNFEKRLIDHKKMYFEQKPFPYVRQSQIRWKLFGPFANQGDLSASFWPEDKDVSLIDSTATILATGGTVWLWYRNGNSYHTWLPSPRKNTTWYAFTQFWSNSRDSVAMWIGFKNILRSLDSKTPPLDQWDYKKSKIWINGEIVPPPKWKFPGRNLEKNLEALLVDEGYYYRPPIIVKAKKGWNSILVKLPLKMDEDLHEWQRRCMFSAMPVHKGDGINWYSDDVKFRVDKK